MKIDITKIPGYAEMTADAKVKLLEEYELDTPAAPEETEEIKKYKQLFDKASSEASDYKKKWQASLSDAERTDLERAEKEKKLAEELKSYKDKERVSNYTAQLMGVGYDEATAKRLAVSLPEGMSEDFFLAQKEFIVSERQKVAVNNLNAAPRPSVGAPVTGNEAYDATTAALRKHMGL